MFTMVLYVMKGCFPIDKLPFDPVTFDQLPLSQLTLPIDQLPFHHFPFDEESNIRIKAGATSHKLNMSEHAEVMGVQRTRSTSGSRRALPSNTRTMTSTKYHSS